jgi:hypothetical protein
LFSIVAVRGRAPLPGEVGNLSGDNSQLH